MGVKQVNKEHYDFSNYLDKKRLISMYHQLDELKRNTKHLGNVLEIGPGPGVFKILGKTLGFKIDTLDIDEDLSPDFIARADDMPFPDNSYEAVCAFQMLEHVPYDLSLKIISEMCRVSNNTVIISLPNARRAWPFSLHVPKKGQISFFIEPWFFKPSEHKFDGEHYWELNKTGFEINKVIKDILNNTKLELVEHYRVKENPYHHFFIFKKIKE